ncbi:hypothetical protein AUR66_18225, partial [Haloferax profundi]
MKGSSNHTDTQIWALIFSTLLVVSTVGVGVPGVATAVSTTDPTVTIENSSVTLGNETTVDIVLSSAPAGVSEFNITVRSTADTTVDISHVDSGDQFGTSSISYEYTDDGEHYQLTAVDSNNAIDPGATNVTLATVTIEGDAPGASDIILESSTITNNSGEPIAHSVTSGHITVNGDVDDAIAFEEATGSY